MGQVTVTVNGRSHTIACDDGQEEHVRALARQVEARVNAIAEASKTAPGDSVLLVLASLTLVDELVEAQAGTGESKPGATGADEIARGLDGLAERVESVARRLSAA